MNSNNSNSNNSNAAHIIGSTLIFSNAARPVSESQKAEAAQKHEIWRDTWRGYHMTGTRPAVYDENHNLIEGRAQMRDAWQKYYNALRSWEVSQRYCVQEGDAEDKAQMRKVVDALKKIESDNGNKDDLKKELRRLRIKTRSGWGDEVLYLQEAIDELNEGRARAFKAMVYYAERMK